MQSEMQDDPDISGSDAFVDNASHYGGLQQIADRLDRQTYQSRQKGPQVGAKVWGRKVRSESVSAQFLS